jgi:hypothetical protein
MAEFGEVPSDLPLIRESIINGRNLGKGSSEPTNEIVGITPVIRWDNPQIQNKTANGHFDFPVDMNRDIDFSIHFIWALTDAESDGDVLNFNFDYTVYIVEGTDLNNTPTTADDPATAVSTGALAAGDVYESVFAIDAQDATNPTTAAQGLGFEISFPTLTDANKLEGVDIISVHMHYTALY